MYGVHTALADAAAGHTHTATTRSMLRYLSAVICACALSAIYLEGLIIIRATVVGLAMAAKGLGG
jgi:hypothetical protein